MQFIAYPLTAEEAKRKARNQKKPTPYQRIIRAAQKDRGVRLTAGEVWQLSFDDAIATRAQLDDEGQP